MQVSIRLLAVLATVAVLAVGCGGARGGTAQSDGGVSSSSVPLRAGSGGDVLSPCEPAGGGQTTTLVESSAQRPPLGTMEAAMSGHPDAQHMVEQLQAEGRTRADALHAMYAQIVGERLIADASQLPGYVTGAYARPLEGKPFELSFSGSVPEELDPDAYDLGSFGLQVTTGAAGLDHEAMAAAYNAADDVGMRTVSAYGDEHAGTGRIEVLDATPEQIAAWEQAVEDPLRWCLVRAARSVPCDDSVVAEAEARAGRQGEALPNEQGEGEPTPERAEEVRRSYLGLTLEASREKAAQENRTIRVVVEDGVPLGRTDDLDPGRISLTVCHGVVVDARMDLEPRD